MEQKTGLSQLADRSRCESQDFCNNSKGNTPPPLAVSQKSVAKDWNITPNFATTLMQSPPITWHEVLRMLVLSLNPVFCSVGPQTPNPPAKPGASEYEPLKAAKRGRQRGPSNLEPPTGGNLAVPGRDLFPPRLQRGHATRWQPLLV